MSKKDLHFNYVSDDTVVIYIHKYNGNKNESPFLRNFIAKNKKLSFFSMSYSSKDVDKESIPITEVTENIEKNISNFIAEHHFKKYYLIGYSLGAAFALAIASKEKIKFEKIILISIFDDRKKLLKTKGIQINPDKNISPIKLISKIKKTPIVFIHGAIDKSVNQKLGRKVYDNSHNPKNKFISLPIGHHFDNTDSKKLLLKSINNIL